MIQTKRCSKCGKPIRQHNKSGLCSHHAMLESRKKRRKLLKLKNVEEEDEC